MKQENNYDEIDKMLFEHFEKDTEIPNSTKNVIHNAFNLPTRQHRKRNYIINNFKKVAIFLITFSIMTTSIVFAKDIVNFIKNIFTNYTNGINTAVENGYIQNVDMDFVIDNDIGIKIDNLIMDENNLDISFIYYSDIPNIINIEINEFIIRNENNQIICFKLDNPIQNIMNPTNFTCTRTANRIISDEKHFNESFLCTSTEIPKSKKLTFEIKNFILTDNTEKKTTIDGNWLYSIDISDKMMKRTTETYSSSYNEYIENISTILSETSLKIELDLKKNINQDILLNPDNIILKNKLEQNYPCLYQNFSNNNNITHIILEFDISKYYENINFLTLFIQYDTNKNIAIHLSK